MKPVRRRLGVPPKTRPATKTPKATPRAPAPRGKPVTHVPGAGRAPRQRPIGKTPNPRKPKLVRDVGGGVLKDLFKLFPDLPRPARPAARVRGRGARIVKKRR